MRMRQGVGDRPLIHLRIELRHPRRSPEPLGPLPSRSPQCTAARRILQHPANCRRERGRLKRLGQGTGDPVVHDVRQAHGTDIVVNKVLITNDDGDVVQETYTTLAGRSGENGESGFSYDTA